LEARSKILKKNGTNTMPTILTCRTGMAAALKYKYFGRMMNTTSILSESLLIG